MPEWLVERGIGESRYARIENGEIVEARVLLDGVVPAGTMLDAKLKSTGRNAIAVAGGVEYMLPKGSHRETEGATVRIEVTREALGGHEPWKRPLASMIDHEPALDPVPKARQVDRFPPGTWEDVLEEARSGLVRFAGGELRIAVTAAMTVIDIDGYLPVAELGVAGASAAARAIRRHVISGSIGIDFPTGADKAGRFNAAAAIDANLPGPYERTAINGFGFMQIIRQRRHASLFELALDRPAFEARALLRTAGSSVGAIRLAVNPLVAAAIRTEWLDELGRRVGGAAGLRVDPAIPMSGGYAEQV